MKYVILSLKHGTSKRACFWRADNAGYTDYPFNAGQYDEATVKQNPGYYNNGVDTVAIPLTDRSMEVLGLKCTYLERSLVNFMQKEKAQ